MAAKKKRGFAWRNAGPSVIVALVLAALFAAAIVYGTRQRAHLSRSLGDLPGLTIALSEAIGYGGMIHNFKNYVLRGDPALADAARADHDRAVALLGRIEAVSRELAISLPLYRLREVLEDYGENLELAVALTARGLAPSEIDAKVRIDDTGALSEIVAAEQAVAAAIRRELDEVALRQNLLLGLLIVTIAVALTLSRARRRRIQAAALRAARAEARARAAIEQNKLLEHRVAERTQDLEQFAQIAAHDLRAPLRALNLVSTLIEEEIEAAGATPDPAGGLPLLRRQAVRMDDLVTGLLEYACAGTACEEETPNCDLAEALRDAVALVAPGHDHEITAEPDLPCVAASEAELELILRNLIGNALKYQDRPDGEVRIRGGRNGGLAWFEIADNGPGIPEAEHQRVLEPFRRLQSKDAIEGCGLGLAAVNRVVRRRGGSVEIGAAHPRGTVVRVELPAGRAVPGDGPARRGESWPDAYSQSA